MREIAKRQRLSGIWKTLVGTSLARIYTLLVGAASLFLTARSLGPEGQGIVAAASSWAMLCSAFGGLSLGQVAQYRIQLRKNDEWLSDILGTLLFFAALLTLITYLIAIILYFGTNGRVFNNISVYVLGIAFMMIPLLIWEEYSKNLLAAVGKLNVYNMAQFWGRTVWLFGILGLIFYKRAGVSEVLIAQIIGQAIIALIGLITLGKSAHYIIRIRRFEMIEMLKDAGKLHLNTVGSFLLAQNTILILNYFANKTDVGYYQIAYQLAVLPAVIPQAASMVLYSEMAASGPDGVWTLQKRMSLQIMAIVALIAGFAYIAAPILVPILVGKNFEPSIRIFRLLLPCVLGMSAAQLMTPQWIGRGVFIPNTILTFGVAIVNVIINVMMIPRFGVMGAVWTSLICYAGITMLVQGIFAWWCEKKFRGSNSGGNVL
jgi:O-antigen/teichoic acid export membrane protein